MRLPACLLLAALLPLPAHATEFRIGNRDVPALIAALQQANRTPGPHRIHLFPGGIYTLQLTDSAGLGLPPIQGELSIEGNKAEIRRYSNTRMTLLEVAAGGRATINDLTLAEGSLGALRNRGELVLNRVSITDSDADDARAIVLNYGELSLRDSLIGYNQIRKVGRDCGIVINLGELDMRDSRIVGNTVSRSAPEAAAAGAVLNFGKLRADRIQFADNDVADPFGGLAFSAVLNLDSGQVKGLDPGSVLNEVLPPL